MLCVALEAQKQMELAAEGSSGLVELLSVRYCIATCDLHILAIV